MADTHMQHTPHAQIPRASPRELSHMPLGINSTEQVFHCCEEDGELITAFLSSFFEIYCRSGKIAQRGIIDMERFFLFFFKCSDQALKLEFQSIVLFCFSSSCSFVFECVGVYVRVCVQWQRLLKRPSCMNRVWRCGRCGRTAYVRWGYVSMQRCNSNWCVRGNMWLEQVLSLSLYFLSHRSVNHKQHAYTHTHTHLFRTTHGENELAGHGCSVEAQYVQSVPLHVHMPLLANTY